MDSSSFESECEKNEDLLDFAIKYKLKGSYLDNTSKDRKRAIRKRAKNLATDKGEIFLMRKTSRVKIVMSTEEYCKHVILILHQVSGVAKGAFAPPSQISLLTQLSLALKKWNSPFFASKSQRQGMQEF